MKKTMETIFYICFFVGVGLTLVSMIFGHFLDLFGGDGIDFFDFNIGLPTSPMVYILFVTVFGGSGLVIQQSTDWNKVWIVVVAFAIAFVISTAFYRGIIVTLKKAQNTSAPNQEELIGVLAKVVETIPDNGYGEIAYVINGNSFKAPAKSSDGSSIEKNTEVSICWVKEYVFYVVKVEE
ncbi:MAG: hypothetical protein IIT46_01380 [Lachnospiraceae bacterium]|nr:hypothetical protein [Lachnospiraceae bacterium]